jgi:dipeptidyl aminopeptidase/acylaminoacyl peptidase
MSIKKSKAPYGRWKSVFSPSEVSKQIRLQDVQWDTTSKTLVWLEERSDRGVLVVRDLSSAGQRDLTRELSVRARISYGGGDFVVHDGSVFYVSEGTIYRQSLEQCHPLILVPRKGEVASPTVSPDGRWLAFVRSHDRVDTLELTTTTGKSRPVVIGEGQDFYMQPCWHPSSKSLAWIAWNHPNMPWDESLLFVAELDWTGSKVEVISKRQVQEDSRRTYFQPQFSPDGRYLSVVSDETGWFNLEILSAETLELLTRVTEEAEHGSAAWFQGLRTYTWTPDSSSIFFLRSKNAFTDLARFKLTDNSISTVEGAINSFTALRQISISPKGDRIAVIGSASDIPPRILSVRYSGEVQVYRRSSQRQPDGLCSMAAPVHWNTGNQTCHGLYYAPTNPFFEDTGPPPAIIKIHGGPTSQYHADYAIDTQFFTSRGYAVLALNYRGSTGYGKSYRNALKGSWGVTDVEDVRSASEFLVSRNLADPKRIVLVGGSAGGYNLLMCFVRYPGTFGAGICRYGVSDLKALAEDTHKFEEHYLDSLVGSLPEDEQIYHDRSPIFHSDRIRDPLAVFQGDADMVVPKTQSDMIVASLRDRDVPHLYRVYSGEGHGWRKLETIEDYYYTVDNFLRRYLLR